MKLKQRICLINILPVFLVLVTQLFMSFTLYAQSSITIAVLDFENKSNSFRLDNLENTVPEMLKTELSRSSYVEVLERSKLEGIFQELALGQVGILDEFTAKQVGELAGAEYIIQGQISSSSKSLRLDAHIIKVATGRVVGEKVTGSDISAMDEMISMLANNIVFNVTGYGQYIQQLRVKQYPTMYLLASTIASGVATIITHNSFKEEYNKYHETTSLSDFDYYYDRASNYRTARNILLYTTGALAITTAALAAVSQAPSNYIFAFGE